MAEFGSSEAGKKGGKARAERLTKEQKTEIARRAAEARWGKAPMPVATHEGVLKLGGFELPCYVLEDGARVFARIQFIQAIGRKGKAKGGRRYDQEFNLPVFLTAENLKPFIPSDLAENSAAIPFVTPTGKEAIGYRAEFMPEVCGVFMDAQDAGVLHKNQIHIAQRCKILIRAFAQVGIIALVDEATGYQRDRARDELAKILEAFVAKEIQKWIKTFDLEFYELICELRGEPLDRVKSRPPYFGKITNNLVYCRLAPGVLEQLKKMSPTDEKGRRKTKLFQGLTPDIGHPKLREHLAGITSAMKMAKAQGMEWEPFLKILDKTHPKHKPMPLFDDQE